MTWLTSWANPSTSTWLKIDEAILKYTNISGNLYTEKDLDKYA